MSLENYNTIVGENNSGKSNILFAIQWFFNEIKIQKKDISKRYQGMPSVKIIFAFDRNEEVPQNIFNEEYEIEDGKYEIEAYLQRFTSKFHAPKHRLLKEGLEPKSVITKNITNLVDVIFMPSIRELDDEFKFTTNSTINRLVSNYVIDKIKNEDLKNSRYKEVERSIKELSDYMAEGETGAFEQLRSSLKNYMLDYKNIELKFRLEPPEMDKLVKDSFEPYIKSNGEELTVDSQGMGYQRSLIFSLICNMADIQLNPSKMILYLIEEPEIFLHPNHQTHFRNKLTDLSEETNNQIILTSHSPYFLNNIKNYSQIKRIYINGNNSVLKELTNDYIDQIRENNGKLMVEAKNAYRISSGKSGWTESKLNALALEIEKADALRYLLWIDPLRANAFLSKKVILVEGPTEKAFFSFIFDNELGEFTNDKKTSEIAVIDTVGKYHFYKFANLLYKLDIPTWIVYDSDVDDEGNNVNERTSISHQKLNEYIEELKTEGIIQDCLKNHPDLEKSLGIKKDYSAPDISIYQKLEKDEAECLTSDKYNEIKNFVENIINYEV